jgi:hypothetical protein
MSTYKFKDSVKKTLRRDAALIGTIAGKLGFTQMYTLRLLTDNDQKLTQKAILEIVSKNLGITEKDLLEEVSNETASKVETISE